MSQPFVGEIRMFGGNFAPAGWAFCSGQIMPISENDVLYTLIGTTYGGDGEQTFGLPNLQGRVPIHMGNGGDGITYTQGEMAGVESVTLTTNTIPIHSHAFDVSTALVNGNTPQNNILGQSASFQMYIQQPPSVALNAGAVAITGGNQPHDNMQPYLCVSFIIALFGIFPSPS